MESVQCDLTGEELEAMLVAAEYVIRKSRGAQRHVDGLVVSLVVSAKNKLEAAMEVSTLLNSLED